MSRILYWLSFGVLAALLFTRALFAQSTIPVTGHLGDSSQGVPPGMSVKFELYSCGSNIPRIFGSFTIVKQSFTLTPDAGGLITGAIWPNDVINCGGVTGGTRYNVTVYMDGVPQTLTACYAVLSTMGTFNLDTATPCTSATPSPPPGGPFDATYNNLTLQGLLSGNNANFTGTVSAAVFRLLTTPTPCPSGFMTGLTATLGVICRSPAASPVTSVNGRTGAVTPQPGDYSCGMIAGAVCSLPTVNYQTVEAAGAAQTQRAKLNLIATGLASFSCVDNAGANSTDCTVNVPSSGGDSATTCTGTTPPWACYYTKPDGTKVEWGVSAAAGTGADTVAVSVSFPLAFTGNVSVGQSADNCADTCSGKNPLVVDQVGGSLSTTGVSFQLTGVTPVGGGGAVVLSTVHVHWNAIGK